MPLIRDQDITLMDDFIDNGMWQICNLEVLNTELEGINVSTLNLTFYAAKQ